MFPFWFYPAWLVIFGASYFSGFALNYRRRVGAVAGEEVKE